MQVAVARKANKGYWDNTNPRNTGYLEKNVPRDALARYERAEAAHANGMENAPYFIGAVLAGNLAGLPSCKSQRQSWCIPAGTDTFTSYDEYVYWSIHRPETDLQHSVYQHYHPQELPGTLPCVDCKYHWSVHTVHQSCEQISGRLIDRHTI